MNEDWKVISKGLVSFLLGLVAFYGHKNGWGFWVYVLTWFSGMALVSSAELDWESYNKNKCDLRQFNKDQGN